MKYVTHTEVKLIGLMVQCLFLFSFSIFLGDMGALGDVLINCHELSSLICLHLMNLYLDKFCLMLPHTSNPTICSSFPKYIIHFSTFLLNSGKNISLDISFLHLWLRWVRKGYYISTFRKVEERGVFCPSTLKFVSSSSFLQYYNDSSVLVPS